METIEHKPQHLRQRVANWPRRRKVAAAVAGFVLALVGGIAIALLLARGEFTGGGNVVAGPDLVITNAEVGSTQYSTCVVTMVGGVPDIQLNDTLAGGYCDVRFTVHRSGGSGETLRFQDVKWNGGSVIPYFTGTDCGKTVGMETDAIATRYVTVRFQVPADTPAGTNLQADTNIAGIYASDEFDPGLCPTPPAA